MNTTDRIRETAATNRFEAKQALKKYIADVFNYVGGQYTDTQGGMIADHVLLEVPSSMTFAEFEEACHRGMKGEGVTSRPSPKTFCDFVRDFTKKSANCPSTYDEDATVPVGTGNEQLDIKRNIAAMWAVMKMWSDNPRIADGHSLRSNWEQDYVFLKSHGLVTEPEGWLKEWREKAMNYIIGSIREKSIGSIREIISGRKMREETARDQKAVMAAVYRLRVIDTLKSWQQPSLDGFNSWFNGVTPELPKCAVMPTNDIYKFQII